MGDILFDHAPFIFESEPITNGKILSISFGDAQESVIVTRPIEVFI